MPVMAIPDQTGRMCKNRTGQDKGLRQKGPGQTEDGRRAVWLQRGDRGDSQRDRTGPDAAGRTFFAFVLGRMESHWRVLGRPVT